MLLEILDNAIESNLNFTMKKILKICDDLFNMLFLINCLISQVFDHYQVKFRHFYHHFKMPTYFMIWSLRIYFVKWTC